MSGEHGVPSEKVYTVQMGCTNCGYEGTVSFKLGKEVPRKVHCPRCECYSMVKRLP